MRSKLGVFSIWIEGSFAEKEELVSEVLQKCSNHFETMGSGKVNPAKLVGTLISQKDNFVN
ncbi:MAG: hypothetical protein ACTHWZ_00940 [Peptoniphilaceae bacterium]